MKNFVTKNFFIYSVPGALKKLLPFITLIISTKYLSLTDFGYLAMFNLCSLPFTILTEMGVGYIINSNWFKLNKKEQGELIFSLLFTSFLITIFVILLVGFVSNIVFTLIVGEDWVHLKPLLGFLFISAISILPSQIFNCWVIIEEKAVFSSIVNVVHIVLVSLSTVLIAILTSNYMYIIIGNVIIGLIFALVQIYFLIKIANTSFSKRYYKMFYRIGAPIFFRSIFIQLKLKFDKIFIANLFGAGQFALYNFAGNVNMLATELTGSFSKVYQPIMYKGLAEKDLNSSYFRKIFFNWSFLTLFGLALVIIFGEISITLLTNGLFTDAYPLVILYTCVISVSLVVIGIGEILIYYEKTKYFLLMAVFNTFAVISLSITLIPKFGAAAGVFALWVGTIIAGTMGFLKKKQLYKNWFIEKLIFPYVVIYHIIAILKYYEIDPIADFIVFIFIGSISVHAYIVNKSLVKKIFSRFGMGFVAGLRQKK